MIRILILLLCSILYGFSAVTSSRQQDSFYFYPQPQDKDVLEGTSVELRCDVSNRDHITFFWTLDNQRIRNSSRRFQEGSNLRILRVNREDDEGAYSCTAINVTTGVSLRSKTARLTVIWISNVAEVQLKVPRQVKDIVRGQEVSLKCQCNGNPEPDVIWFKNRLRLDESEQVRFHKSRLKIAAAEVQDNGVYSCQASNGGGQATSLTNFILNVPGTGGAELVTETFTQYQLVKQGSNAYFNCEYTNAIMTEWYFGNTKLTNDMPGNKFTVQDNGSLVIHSVQPRDAGGYSCVGLANQGGVQKFVAELLLAYLDDLSSDHLDPPPPPPGEPVVIPVNSKYRVRCILPSGLPIPTQGWESPQGAVLSAEGRVTAVDGQLSITGAQVQDSGNYTCVVTNLAGEKSIKLLIIVSEPPIISQHPQEVRVLEGEDASFKCSVSGTPYPVTRITWTKDDLPIDPLSSHYLMNEELGTLTIHNVRPSDHANYACVATSKGHTAAVSFSRTLFVKKKLKFRPAPVDKKLELGEEAEVHCRVDGDNQEQNPITVTWHRQGQDTLGSHVMDTGGVLRFEPVEKQHAGRYSCVAESHQGKINHSISIQVVVKPWFKVHPENTTVYEGQTVMLHCVVEGDPKPNVRWDKNSHIEDFDKTRVNLLKNGSLFIKEALLEDIGRYGCTAGNSWGFLREEMYLTVKTGSPKDNFGMMKTIIIAVCSAVAYLAIVIGLTVYCSIRLVKMKNRGKNKRNTEEDNNTAKLENGTAPSERTELMDKKTELDLSAVKPVMSEDSRSHVSGLSSSHSSQPSSQRSGQSFVSKYAFPRHDLQTLGMLGKGFYGDVFLAKAHQIVTGEMETLVVVKSLLLRDEPSSYEFRREMDMFSKLNHDHVVKLLGVCRDMEPQFLITEYCEWGDLKQFLWALRKDNGRTAQIQLPPLSLGQKVTMCIQVASGMEHISHHRFVHKDLAARNILLAPNLDLKISNLGLCRDIYKAEYFSFRQLFVPLRWLAPEAILEDEYSTKSDVWAFGCFVWEVFSLGDLPHKHRVDEEVLQALHNGDCILADKPVGCPQELWDLVQRCTLHSPTNRPSFTEICTNLGDLTVDSDV